MCLIILNPGITLQVFDLYYVIIYLICQKIDIKDINLRDGLSSWVVFRSHFSITSYSALFESILTNNQIKRMCGSI